MINSSGLALNPFPVKPFLSVDLSQRRVFIHLQATRTHVHDEINEGHGQLYYTIPDLTDLSQYGQAFLEKIYTKVHYHNAE